MVNQLSDSLINISNQIGEQITSSKIEIKYQKNGAMLNLSLNPSSEEENILSTKLNVHFLDDNLPPEENLVASFIENKDNFLETLNHIFEED